jgi:nicotinamidase-related amidase
LDDPVYEIQATSIELFKPKSSSRPTDYSVDSNAIVTSKFITLRHIFQVEEKKVYWTEGAKTESVSKSQANTAVFIIDPQIDFHRGGSFPIEGAMEDSLRIAQMIKKNKSFIHNIFVALDTHYFKHITHATYWRDKYGKKPPVFTKISYKDVKEGVWIPRDDSSEELEWCLKYTQDLEKRGRPKLTIWPEHCIIGTRGHAVVPCINDALQEWAMQSKRPVQYIMKGYNYRTEMYSALEAEVVDPADYSTSLNFELLSMLRISDRVRTLYVTYFVF